MKWYEREYGFKGQPYRYFLADVIWSAVAVMIVAFVMILMGAALPTIAVACVIPTLLLARMIVRRAAAQRVASGRLPVARHSYPSLSSRTLTGT